MRLFIGVIVGAWLVIGTIAAGQRGYFNDDVVASCKTGANTGLTVAAGPLNYAGVDPQVNCTTPKPSS
jgi:hypothetical protein